MSYRFNDPQNLNGLVQMYEKECGYTYGDVSGSPTRLKQFAAAVNEALDDYFALALTASGRWQLDDSNHEDYPIIEGDLVEGQRDVAFTEDETGNLILDIYRVFVKDRSGVYREVSPVDEQSDRGTQSFTDGQDAAGTPARYDKTGNGIRFDVVPDYSWRKAEEEERGVKIYINRTASYFSYSDTTKRPGVPATDHKYFYLKPAYVYARRNGLANLPAIAAELQKMEGDEAMGIVGSIARRYGWRAKDERRIMRPRLTPFL